MIIVSLIEVEIGALKVFLHLGMSLFGFIVVGVGRSLVRWVVQPNFCGALVFIMLRGAVILVMFFFPLLYFLFLECFLFRLSVAYYPH